MRKIIIFTFILLSALLVGCDDPLDLKHTNQWDEDEVWRMPVAAEGVLIKAYDAIPNLPDYFGGNFIDAATDNAMTNDQTSSAWEAGNGLFSRYNSVIGNWGQAYNQFQNIHMFLDKGLTDKTLYDRTSEETDARFKEKLEGEAYFLRAWWGFQLLQRHGGRADDGKALGYPIVTRFINKDEVNDPELYIRNSYAECVQQILDDCDAAIEKLPDQYAGDDAVTGLKFLGRATTVAAKVLKSNVTLYAASPAYQDNDVVSIEGMGKYTVLNQGVVEEKWIAAALTANEALKTDGFGNFTAIKSNDLADANANNTPGEFVFRRLNNSINLENRHNPPFNFGVGSTVPSENLVRAFPSKNGFPIDDARSNYDESTPYTNRDNRFLLNVHHHGREYFPGVELNMVYGGNGSAAYSKFASKTGYYLAKFIHNRDYAEYYERGNIVHYHPYLRKAEVFLNFAEASNEAWGPHGIGPDCQYSAYDVIKTIRAKSGGITDVTYLDEMAADKDSFRKLIQNERRLELAFENHRFFDMRRCLLPLNETVQGVEVTLDAQSNLIYTVVDVEQRPMNDVKYYFLPLPSSELNKSSNLKNNMDWDTK